MKHHRRRAGEVLGPRAGHLVREAAAQRGPGNKDAVGCNPDALGNVIDDGHHERRIIHAGIELAHIPGCADAVGVGNHKGFFIVGRRIPATGGLLRARRAGKPVQTQHHRRRRNQVSGDVQPVAARSSTGCDGVSGITRRLIARRADNVFARHTGSGG